MTDDDAGIKLESGTQWRMKKALFSQPPQCIRPEDRREGCDKGEPSRCGPCPRHVEGSRGNQGEEWKVRDVDRVRPQAQPLEHAMRIGIDQRLESVDRREADPDS